MVAKAASLATSHVTLVLVALALGNARVHKITRSAKGSPLAIPWVKLAVVVVAALSLSLLLQPVSKPLASAPEPKTAWRIKLRRSIGGMAFSGWFQMTAIIEVGMCQCGEKRVKAL
jgi:hypothetical protein